MKNLGEIVPINPQLIKVIDVGGAVYNTPDRYAGLAEHYNLRIEKYDPEARAQPEIYQRENVELTCRSDILADGNQQTLQLTRARQLSSLYQPDPTVVRRFRQLSWWQEEGVGPYKLEDQVSVPTARLDDVCDVASPHFLKLDVQGAELDVLRGSTRTLQSVLIIESEVEFVQIYKNQPLFSDMDIFLREQGFQFHKMMDVEGRAIGPMRFNRSGGKSYSQVLWADALFLKREILEAPEKLSPEELAVAACILHDVYRSYDFVVQLLIALENKIGGSLSDAYYTEIKHARLDRLYMNIVDHW
ncbi:MAG: FkbM family methyltransferase [Alphaproteobacteria bacterium]|nr:FkbM family methyltransferase [Alphaproteobacteria bacterium]